MRRFFQVLSPFDKFLKMEAAGGVVLMLAAVFSFACVNSESLYLGTTLADFHARLVALPVTLGWGRAAARMSLELWVNDGLMAIYFFVVGLEIKREVSVGHLNSARKVAFPALAAIGGALVPAAIYAVINRGSQIAIRGWGIPMATDIAFAVGVLSLFGRRVPAALKIFLLALAIVDDLLAILVIAVFYTAEVRFFALAAAAGVFFIIQMMKMSGIRSYWAYVVAGIAAWSLVLASGVHATIAGVLLGLMTPMSLEGGGRSPIDRLLEALHPWTTFLIIPIFAFLNAGVKLAGGPGGISVTSPIVLGVVLGLVLGKPLGIFLTTVASKRMNLIVLPEGVELRQILAVACLGGIGFTMSLFIAGLSFSDGVSLVQAKGAIAAASLTSALIGSFMMNAVLPRKSPA